MNDPTIFDIIAEAARKADVRLILIGGFAVNAYNYARNTKDIDFLTTDEDYRKLSEVLSLSGYEESLRTEVFAKRTRKGTKDLPVDFLFVDPSTFEIIWRGGQEAIFFGHKFRLPSLLHLMALKLHAVKQGTKNRSWKDIPDILNLIEANGIDVHAPAFIEICHKYGPEGIHSEILKMLAGGENGRS